MSGVIDEEGIMDTAAVDLAQCVHPAAGRSRFKLETGLGEVRLPGSDLPHLLIEGGRLRWAQNVFEDEVTISLIRLDLVWEQHAGSPCVKWPIWVGPRYITRRPRPNEKTVRRGVGILNQRSRFFTSPQVDSCVAVGTGVSRVKVM